MPILEIIMLAIALAMDAFAVALSTGIRQSCSTFQTLRMSLAFGFFQFIMPLAGWFLGTSIQKHIEAVDHWIAFGLLLGVGLHMLWESCTSPESEGVACSDHTSGTTLIMLAIATSVDALAVGISIAVLEISILKPAVVIGIVCFTFTWIGIKIGHIFSRQTWKIGRAVNIFGALILIAIGIKVLCDHIL